MTSDSKIIGGQDAPEPIPWQVSVREGKSGSGHSCGGTILDETTVLCAAHCFKVCQDMKGWYIMAGAIDRNSKSGQVNILMCFLSKINIHFERSEPGYKV